MTRVLPWRDTADARPEPAEAITPTLTTPAGDPVPLEPASRPQARVPVAHWSRLFVRQLLVTDALCAAAAVALGWFVRYGFPSDAYVDSYIRFSVLITVGWLAALYAVGGYEIRRISTGSREFQRVLRASLNLAGTVAITGYLTGIVLARTFLAIVIPFWAVLMVLARYGLRRTVHARRRRGNWTSSILAVGTSESVWHLAEVLARNPHSGLVVVAACVEDAEIGSEIADHVPVVGDLNHAADVAAHLGVDIVAVAGSGLGPRRIRELGWDLEGTGCNMVMAPGLTGVAGPRVHVSPVEGLPLMWVDQPQFTGVRRLVKRCVDLLGATATLVLAAPLLLVVAVLVRATSRGPVLYRSIRMGQDGRQFRVYKFRSMYRDADERRSELIELNESTGGMLFKMRRDPRVTPVGRILRKFSLDELPQLFNVIGGSMSLVGPRPPLPDEVQRYLTHDHRRLLVKPGMTGLWQVSGRSNLSWDESVRLDLYYVENWSLTFDLAIIVRTVWAVLRSYGAY
jgi:exopolysaccharide biosynthesis polyprenyl glycosylphosphotransferase